MLVSLNCAKKIKTKINPKISDLAEVSFSSHHNCIGIWVYLCESACTSVSSKRLHFLQQRSQTKLPINLPLIKMSCSSPANTYKNKPLSEDRLCQ